MLNTHGNVRFTMRPSDCIEKDFFLKMIGYNDFHFIEPLKTPHVQDFYTLHYVLSGSGYLHIHGKTFLLKKSDVFFIPPNEIMYYYPDTNDPWTYVWFEFDGKNSSFYAEKIGFSDKETVLHCENYAQAYNALYDIFRDPDTNAEIGYHYALSIFYKFIDILSKSGESSGENLFNEIKAFIECHYHRQELTAESVCREFKISHSYLCKLFKKEHGLKHLIITTRINHSLHFLENSELSIRDIAYSVGFSDNIQFMKMFKKITGITAGEYRKLKGIKNMPEA